MPIDASIYQNSQPIPVKLPDPVQSVEGAMKLSQLGMQQMQMAREMRSRADMQDALYRNTDPQTGQFDQTGYLSQLGKINPMAAQQETGRLAAQNEAVAKAQAAKLDASEKAVGVVYPAFNHLMTQVPEDQRADVYPKLLQQMKAQGVDTSQFMPDYDKQVIGQQWQVMQQHKPILENFLTQSQTAKNLAEAGPMAAAKLNADLYGSRSPNAELTSQYNEQVKPIRGSQMAMGQMLDNYKNPSPQGDASLILNAFKIKFPNAPDVNSLEELSKSQAAPDQFKQWANKAISGGLDQNTRDNLMRDGISTFRANVNTLGGIQEKFRGRAKAQNVGDTSFVNEPSVDKTYAEAMALQKGLGPYKPPAERGGAIGAVYGMASKLLGSGKEPIAAAAGDATPPQSKQGQQPKYRAQGAAVSADELAKYATDQKTTLTKARKHLEGLGYVIGR